MKKIVGLAGYVTVLLLMAISCGPREPETPEGTMEFVLYEDENEVQGTQAVVYGKSRMYTLKSAFVTSMEIKAPEGWKAEFYAGDRIAVITAPAYEDTGAEASGDVRVSLKSASGQSKEFILPVAVMEGDIQLSFIDDVTGTVEFYLGASRTFSVNVSDNVSELEISVPQGWSSSYDLSASPAAIEVTPPEDKESGNLSGRVTVLPKSPKGTAGGSASFDAEIIVTIPELAFDNDSETFQSFGQSRDITFTSEYVLEMEKTAVPAGWDVSFDIAGGKMTVTAPSAPSADVFGNGTITVKATSQSGHTVEESYMCLCLARAVLQAPRISRRSVPP